MRLRSTSPTFVACALLLCGAVRAATLSLDIRPSFGVQPLQLDSLKYATAQQETLSLSRLSLLLSDFALETESGEWMPLETRYAFIDAASRRLDVNLGNMPEGAYRAIRFSIGPDPETNHADPARYASNHPLNPALNNLLWDWQSGYIFLALEGRFRSTTNDLGGFVLHYANDWNRTLITMPVRIDGATATTIEIVFDLEALFNLPTPISLANDGQTTHSREDDPLAACIKNNLPSAFRINRVARQTIPSEMVQKAPPLYLPKTFQPYPFKMGSTFPQPDLPSDNPLTQARVELGETLFNDKALSFDGTISCATCHKPEQAFTDSLPVAVGINGSTGTRNSMPLFNLAWKSEFFWDGRAPSLRDQVVQPITNALEMASDYATILGYLQENTDYAGQFSKAFDPPDPTIEKLALALEAYLLTLTSHNARFDQAMQGKATLTAEERRGMELFFTEYDPRTRQYGADCFHCHGGALFTDRQFHDNGIVPASDQGRFQTTGKESDRYKFSTPSLRNVALTAPYMHDGRFQTLEDVLNHYTSPMERSDTLDPNLAKHPATGLELTESDQAALVAFLKTLTDGYYLDLFATTHKLIR